MLSCLGWSSCLSGCFLTCCMLDFGISQSIIFTLQSAAACLWGRGIAEDDEGCWSFSLELLTSSNFSSGASSWNVIESYVNI